MISENDVRRFGELVERASTSLPEDEQVELALLFMHFCVAIASAVKFEPPSPEELN